MAAETAGMAGPKVCFLFPHLNLGGGETAMMEVADGLRCHFDISVCALERRKAVTGPTIERELQSRFGSVQLARSEAALQDLLEGVDLLVWYGTNRWTPTALSALSRRPGSIRVVHTDKKEEGVEFCARWRDCIDAVSCVSPVVQRLVPGSVTIPNTVSHRYLTGGARAFFAPEAAGARKTIGYLGRLYAFKNVNWLIENLEHLGCNLLVQGLDSEELTRNDLRRRSERSGTADRVHVLDPGRDVGTLLRSVDALAVVSQREGFPMVAIEAGMVGTPVIASRVGALPEVFAEEMLFVDLRDGVPTLESFTSALARVTPRWGERLHRKVSQFCSRDAVVTRYAELIRAVLDGRRPRGT